jgi:hypothetical protein
MEGQTPHQSISLVLEPPIGCICSQLVGEYSETMYCRSLERYVTHINLCEFVGRAQVGMSLWLVGRRFREIGYQEWDGGSGNPLPHLSANHLRIGTLPILTQINGSRHLSTNGFSYQELVSGLRYIVGCFTITDPRLYLTFVLRPAVRSSSPDM